MFIYYFVNDFFACKFPRIIYNQFENSIFLLPNPVQLIETTELCTALCDIGMRYSNAFIYIKKVFKNKFFFVQYLFTLTSDTN